MASPLHFGACAGISWSCVGVLHQGTIPHGEEVGFWQRNPTFVPVGLDPNNQEYVSLPPQRPSGFEVPLRTENVPQRVRAFCSGAAQPYAPLGHVG